ncbi:MAG: ADOP family duplicated permease [Gemmatimonadales bacterium]
MLRDLFSEIRYRLRALVARGAMDHELDEEVRFHLEQEAAKLERAGHPPAEARRRARLAFGGVERVKEESREGRGISVVEQVGRDLRFALRGIRQRPGFAGAVIVTLGLGIGANAAMFGVVDRLMFRAPPFLRDPGTVHRVMVTTTDDGRDNTENVGVYTRYLDIKRWATTITEAAGYASRNLAVGTGTDAREMPVSAVSASYFGFFDLKPALGRLFGVAEDTTPVGALVAVLSHTHWRLAYGGRPDVIGTPVQIGKGIYTIIGVAPDGFTGLEMGKAPVAWIPITAYAGVFRGGDPGYYTRYNWGWMEMIVRLRADVSPAALSADLSRATVRSYQALLAIHPKWPGMEKVRPRGEAVPIQMGRGPTAAAEAKVAVWVAGVSLIVMLIGCANVANLFFGRALGRRREIAVRLAMGVSRRRLIAELVTEGLVLSLLGGALGVLVAQSGASVFRSLFLPEGTVLPVLGDGRTLGFALLVSIFAGVVTALAPALDAARGDFASHLRSGGREVGRRSRVRSGLLVAQGALSVVLLVGAGLFVRSLDQARSVRLGFDVENLVVIGREMRSVKLSDTVSALLVEQLEQEAARIPGVVAAARALTVPMYDTWSESLFVPGIDSVARLGQFTLQAGSADFFRTAGTRILRGRGLTADDRANGPRVGVVSESMAAVLWPGKDPIGQCFRVDADTMPCTTVVGVAENLRQSGLTEEGHSYYLAIDQFHPGDAQLFVRVAGDAEREAEPIRRRLQALMPGDSYLIAVPATKIVAPQLASWRSGATMFLAFGALALGLAAIGLYSVIAYDVSRRTQELGVRMALGAGADSVLRLVVGEGVRLAVVGVAIGSVVALGAGRWVEPLLFRQSARDPAVFAVVTVVLLAAAALASVIPARRAARLDPNSALRAE